MVISLRRNHICGHCGRDDIGTPQAGYGAIGKTRLCHPNEPGRPDCFRLVTVYGHTMPCRCSERAPRAGDRSAAVWA